MAHALALRVVHRQLEVLDEAGELGLRLEAEHVRPEVVEVERHRRHVALGLRNAEVAEKLAISEPTIKTHLNSIFRKLGIRDRVELTLYAARAGLIRIP